MKCILIFCAIITVALCYTRTYEFDDDRQRPMNEDVQRQWEDNPNFYTRNGTVYLRPSNPLLEIPGPDGTYSHRNNNSRFSYDKYSELPPYYSRNGTLYMRPIAPLIPSDRPLGVYYDQNQPTLNNTTTRPVLASYDHSVNYSNTHSRLYPQLPVLNPYNITSGNTYGSNSYLASSNQTYSNRDYYSGSNNYETGIYGAASRNQSSTFYPNTNVNTRFSGTHGDSHFNNTRNSQYPVNDNYNSNNYYGSSPTIDRNSYDRNYSSSSYPSNANFGSSYGTTYNSSTMYTGENLRNQYGNTNTRYNSSIGGYPNSYSNPYGGSSSPFNSYDQNRNYSSSSGHLNTGHVNTGSIYETGTPTYTSYNNSRTTGIYGNSNQHNTGSSNTEVKTHSHSARISNNDSIQDCIKQCVTTFIYNPVCGSNQLTYSNIGQLNCEKDCGVGVSILHYGICTPSKVYTS